MMVESSAVYALLSMYNANYWLHYKPVTNCLLQITTNAINEITAPSKHGKIKKELLHELHIHCNQNNSAVYRTNALYTQK